MNSVKIQIMIQGVLSGGPPDSAFLTSFRVMSTLLVCRPHFEQQRSRPNEKRERTSEEF